MKSSIYSGSYQLVSEHSILSARRKNRDTAGTPRTRSQRLEAYRERVRQIGATRESYCHHDANTTTPDFKVYDRGRGRTEDENSRRRRSREDEFYDKLEEMAEILSSYLSNVAVKSRKPEEEGNPELEDVKPEADQSEWNDGGHVGEIGGGIEPPWKPAMEANVEQGSPEELTPEDSPPETTDGGTTLGEASPSHDLGKSFLSRETELCNREEKEERARRSGGIVERISDDAGREQLPEEEDDGATVEAEGIAHEGPLFSFSVEGYESVAIERESKSKRISRQMDLKFNSLGQAQSLIVTPPQFTYNRGVLLIKGIMDKKEFAGSDWAQNLAARREFDPGAVLQFLVLLGHHTSSYGIRVEDY